MGASSWLLGLNGGGLWSYGIGAVGKGHISEPQHNSEQGRDDYGDNHTRHGFAAIR